MTVSPLEVPMSMTRALFLSSSLLACLLLAACGGGGGGGGDDADASLLSGTHFLWAFGAREDTPDEGSAAWAVVTLDGAGALTGTAENNTAGSLSGATPVMGTYTVAGDRETTLTVGAGYAGWTHAAGTAVIGGAVTGGSQPACLGLLELGAGFSDADLQGDWRGVVLLVDGAGDMASNIGPLTLDATGAGSFASIERNQEGTVGTVPGSPVDFDVAGNGQVTVALGGATVLEGAVHAGGDLIICTGSTVGGDDPFWAVFIRQTTGASDATLAGTYQLVGVERDGGGFASITGSVQADGAGSLTAQFTKNTDGVISNQGPEIVSYAVQADGGLAVDTAGDLLAGGVSGNGTFAVIGGPLAAMSNPRMYILMRR